jgi:tetratricopeptide (TPR) repeat protein
LIRNIFGYTAFLKCPFFLEKFAIRNEAYFCQEHTIMKNLNILILAVAFLTGSALAQTDNFDSRLDSCLTLANAKNYPKAIESCTAAIALKPTDDRPYYFRGMVNYFTGTTNSFNDAALDFKKCIELNPKYAESYYMLGIVTASFRNAKVEKYDEGIKSFTEAIRLGTDNKDVYYQRGEAYRRAADTLTDFVNYVTSDNNAEKEANLKRGSEYFKLALADYQKSLEINPTLDSALLGLGICQSKTGLLDLAIATLTQYIEKKPDNKEAYEYRAGAYFGLKKYQLALNDAEIGLELNKTKYLSESEKKEFNDIMTALRDESRRILGMTAPVNKKTVTPKKKP